jgi:hypothetical protein
LHIKPKYHYNCIDILVSKNYYSDVIYLWGNERGKVMLNDAEIAKFKSSLRGQLIQPTDNNYDEARKLYNAMIDKRPLLIARCADVADVISAVRFGRDNNLLTAIRCGGHNGPGLGSCDDGLVIDLSLMKGVCVDPANRTISAGGGCTQGSD